jgi:Type IV secretion system pilin
MLAQNTTDNFLPTGTTLCPRGGCRVLDPNNFRGGTQGFLDIVVNLASIATYIIAVLAVVYIIYAAFLFLMGGEKGGEKGRKVIINSIISIIIAALSFTFIQLLVNVLDQLRI